MAESNGDGKYHEPASVQIARLVCQALVTLCVLAAALVLVLTRPEYNSGVALVCGIVLAAWFVVPAQLRWNRHRHRDDDD